MSDPVDTDDAAAPVEVSAHVLTRFLERTPDNGLVRRMPETTAREWLERIVRFATPLLIHDVARARLREAHHRGTNRIDYRYARVGVFVLAREPDRWVCATLLTHDQFCRNLAQASAIDPPQPTP